MKNIPSRIASTSTNGPVARTKRKRMQTGNDSHKVETSVEKDRKDAENKVVAEEGQNKQVDSSK